MGTDSQTADADVHCRTGSLEITQLELLVALFVTGFTHDILLETGVFLVSVKLIVLSYKASVSSNKIEQELKEILKQNSESR